MAEDGQQIQLLRRLPAVAHVLRHLETSLTVTGKKPGAGHRKSKKSTCTSGSAISPSLLNHGRDMLVDAVRQVLGSLRHEILSGRTLMEEELGLAAIAERAMELVQTRARLHLRPVINATGVILHTNLGRAVLAAEVRDALDSNSGYCNLELDLESGRRGSRQAAIEGLLIELTGAQSAFVVNNNAAAILLTLNTLAAGREVIVSRGQLVEIGGSFRVPEVMSWSGALLREVGTTNKTYLEDYRRAVTAETAALLRVHTSNFKVIGFTREVSVPELVDLGRGLGLPVVEDLGSGLLLDLTAWGIQEEPVVPASLRAGVDVVTFSADKLLGGPQAGIIAGRACYLDPMKNNPLARALRLDKLGLAALEATLRLYLDPETARSRVPTLAMLIAPAKEVKSRAVKFRQMFLKRTRFTGAAEEAVQHGRCRVVLEIKPSTSEAGGGSLPGFKIPTWVIAIRSDELRAEALAARLRRGAIPVLSRIEDELLLLDLRTVAAEEEPLLQQALLAALANAASRAEM